MATAYSGRYSNPLGGGDNAFGGAGLNLDIHALGGATELVTTFDDFNDRVAQGGNAADTPRTGWTAADVGVPVAELIDINDPANTPQPFQYQSSLRVSPGTADDTGCSLQITGETQGHSPHIWLQDRDADAGGNDNSTIVLACRIGLGQRTSVGGVWQGKMFVGWAQSGNQQVMTPATGAIDGTNGSLLGFHVAEDGHIDLISVRENVATLVGGTHFTQLVSTTWNTGIVAGDTGLNWFDLALRAGTADVSNATDNGAVQGFVRLVPQIPSPGRRPIQPSSPTTPQTTAWQKVPTILLNQLLNDTGLELVPTIEVQNGAATANDDSYALVDWWAMGITRASRF